ncbi:hypothetical protein [Actinoallomurus sp. NPDC050550]|uniref:hypothetical protein n=1 Tax=Actinoallomurus sp. NPDC050550 TaxID=3154937 RepID=UPI0033D70251
MRSSVLKQEEFRWFFTGQAISLLGSSMAPVALTFVRLGQLAGALAALPLLALSARLDTPWLVTAALIAGLGISVTGIAWETSLHEHVPRDVLSRVASYNDLLSYVTIPIGQLSVAPLTHAFGGFRVAATAGIVSSAAAVAPLVSGTVRRLRAH